LYVFPPLLGTLFSISSFLIHCGRVALTPPSWALFLPRKRNPSFRIFSASHPAMLRRALGMGGGAAPCASHTPSLLTRTDSQEVFSKISPRVLSCRPLLSKYGVQRIRFSAAGNAAKRASAAHFAVTTLIEIFAFFLCSSLFSGAFLTSNALVQDLIRITVHFGNTFLFLFGGAPHQPPVVAIFFFFINGPPPRSRFFGFGERGASMNPSSRSSPDIPSPTSFPHFLRCKTPIELGTRYFALSYR